MNCPFCNQEFAFHDENCKKCGKPKPGKITPEIIAKISNVTNISPADENVGANMEGIKGWLYFWCLFHTVLAPGIYFGDLFFGSLRYDFAKRQESLIFILDILVMVLSVIAGRLVWTRSSEAKKY